MNLQAIYGAVHGMEKLPNILALDPGNTLGWSYWEEGVLKTCGQIECVKGEMPVWSDLDDMLRTCEPDYIVCEDYRVYSHKLERHTFSRVPTIQLIGMIDYCAWCKGVPVCYQMANEAKGFVTDKKLKEWDVYNVGQRHSRDSMRHALYFYIVKLRQRREKAR